MRTATALLFLVAGCGDDTNNVAPPDYATHADMAVGPNVDFGKENFPDLGVNKATEAIVTTSSFTMGGTGTLNTIALSPDHTVTKSIDATLDQDNDVFVSDGKAFVLDHTHGTVRVYDPTAGFAQPIEIALDPASNPHGIVAIPTTTKAYVSLYGAKAATAIAVIDWSMPSKGAVKSIAVPQASADTDGIPEAADVYLCGQFVYVGLQDLDETKGFAPTGLSRIVVIDSLTDALDTSAANVLQMKGANPNGIAPKGTGCDIVLVADAANQFGDLDGSGGIEEIDLAQRTSNGIIVKDTDLMGHPGTMATNPAKQLAFTVLSVMDGAGSQLVAVDYMANKLVTPALLGTAGFIRFAQVSPDGQLFAGVSFGANSGPPAVGVFVGPADGTVLSAAAIDLGQAPYSIAFF